jgi:hypothetical protein
MSPNERQHLTQPDARDSSEMTEERVAQLRNRVTTGYYDQPHVLEAVARAIIKGCPPSSWAARPDSSGRV